MSQKKKVCALPQVTTQNKTDAKLEQHLALFTKAGRSSTHRVVEVPAPTPTRRRIMMSLDEEMLLELESLTLQWRRQSRSTSIPLTGVVRAVMASIFDDLQSLEGVESEEHLERLLTRNAPHKSHLR